MAKVVIVSMFCIARQYREAAKISNKEKELVNKLETQKEEISKMEDLLLTENAMLTSLNDQLSSIHDERVIMEKEEGKLVVLLNAS